MSGTNQQRHRRGTQRGGQFAPSQQEEPAIIGIAPGAGERNCATCGAPTKRTSGQCRKCDPSRKKTPSSASKTPTAASAEIYDTSGGPIPVEEIQQCTFEFVPQVRRGQATVNLDGARSMRPCKNAVRAPAERCHRHGGGVSTSLGRTFAKATAEAGRGSATRLRLSTGTKPTNGSLPPRKAPRDHGDRHGRSRCDRVTMQTLPKSTRCWEV